MVRSTVSGVILGCRIVPRPSIQSRFTSTTGEPSGPASANAAIDPCKVPAGTMRIEGSNVLDCSAERISASRRRTSASPNARRAVGKHSLRTASNRSDAANVARRSRAADAALDTVSGSCCATCCSCGECHVLTPLAHGTAKAVAALASAAKRSLRRRLLKWRQRYIVGDR